MADKTRPLRMDRIYDLDPLEIKDSMMRLMGVQQKDDAATVTSASAALFLEVCRRYKVEPRDVLDATQRILRASREKHPIEWRALRRYMKERMADAL